MKRTPNRVGGENSCCCMRLSEEFLNKAARSWAKTELSRGELGLPKPKKIQSCDKLQQKSFDFKIFTKLRTTIEISQIEKLSISGIL